MKNELSINLKHMRNDEHYQLFCEFYDLVTDFDATELKIEPLFDEFSGKLEREDEALKRINKSAITPKINEADKYRDEIFRGLAESYKLATRHFRDKIRKPAKELQVVFDTYGNLSRKPRNEKTSAIYNLLKELTEKHPDQVKAIGLEEWVNELQMINAECQRLTKDRWAESASRCKIVLKEARADSDAAYEAIIKRILALQEVEASEIYERFVTHWSAVLDTFNATLAQRKGRRNIEGDDDLDQQDGEE